MVTTPTQNGQVQVTKHEVTPQMKRRLLTAISDHWATKILFNADTEQDFFAQLGRLHAQLSGDLPFELTDFKSKTALVFDEQGDPTTTAFFYAPLPEMRRAKWTLNKSLDLDYLPQGRRMLDGGLRFSIPKMTKRAARQVFDENRDLFTKIEFHDDIVAQERAAKKAAKLPAVFNVPAPVLPDREVTTLIKEDVADIEAMFNEEVEEKPAIVEQQNIPVEENYSDVDLSDLVVEQSDVPHIQEITEKDVDDLLDI